MGFISRTIVATVNVGCLLSGLYCVDKYFTIWNAATSSTHEVTGTLFGIGAIISFGIVSISILLGNICSRLPFTKGEALEKPGSVAEYFDKQEKDNKEK